MFFKKFIGLDLGTQTTRLVFADKGITLSIPTLIAKEKDTKKVVAIGNDAEELYGKSPNDIEVIRPIKNSVIANFRALESFLKHLFDYSLPGSFLYKPIVIISVPSSINSVEKRALEEAAINAGARDVYLYPTSYLSAVGAGLDIHKPFGNMILNIGAGSTESAVLSFNGIVVYNAVKVGSFSINESLITYIKKIYGLIIGELMSEKIKVQVGSVLTVDNPKQIEVRGRDASTGMPKIITLDTNDIVDAIRPITNQIVMAIRSVLEKTPPELSSDIVDNGIIACGGGIQLNNLDELIKNAIGIPVIKVDSPENTVALGIQKIMQDFDLYSQRGFIK